MPDMRIGWWHMALFIPLGAMADEKFRCGQWIASSEMSVQELLSKCGEPQSRTQSSEDILVRNPNTGLMLKNGEVLIEKWTYDRGTQAAPMVVTIVDGRIKSIERQK
jgi:hypothetical protein